MLCLCDTLRKSSHWVIVITNSMIIVVFQLCFFFANYVHNHLTTLLDKYSSIIGVERTMTQIVIHHKMTFVFFFLPNYVPISIGSTCLRMLLNRNLIAC